jgi:hypothetical protein
MFICVAWYVSWSMRDAQLFNAYRKVILSKRSQQ